MFPSPIGELHFSILLLNVINVTGKKFPSPIGELHFSIANKVVVRLYEKVSVPYRGATFLNRQPSIDDSCSDVSVPYRGATFLNEKYPTCKFSIRTFPSPIGELHFSIIYSWAKGECRAVSVPYRGATFLNLTQIHLARKKHCFRPLSGSYISQ